MQVVTARAVVSIVRSEHPISSLFLAEWSELCYGLTRASTCNAVPVVSALAAACCSRCASAARGGTRALTRRPPASKGCAGRRPTAGRPRPTWGPHRVARGDPHAVPAAAWRATTDARVTAGGHLVHPALSVMPHRGGLFFNVRAHAQTVATPSGRAAADPRQPTRGGPLASGVSGGRNGAPSKTRPDKPRMDPNR